MLETRVIYLTDDSVPKTGLSPVFTYLNDGTGNVTLPTITERGSGFYAFNIDVEAGKIYTGVIDAGVALTENSERYVPVVMQSGDTIVPVNTDVYTGNITPVYIESSDTAVFVAFLQKNGEILLVIDSISIAVFDSTNTELFTVTSNAISDNGTFTLTKTTPGFASSGIYYAVAVYTIGAETITSNETMIVIN